jgi:hypothetical protein
MGATGGLSSWRAGASALMVRRGATPRFGSRRLTGSRSATGLSSSSNRSPIAVRSIPSSRIISVARSDMKLPDNILRSDPAKGSYLPGRPPRSPR